MNVGGRKGMPAPPHIFDWGGGGGWRPPAPPPPGSYAYVSMHIIDFTQYFFVTQPCSIKKITKDTVASSLL